MLYLKNDTELQEVKIFASVPRGTYTEPINPNPEGGVTEYEVEQIVDSKLNNYYDKQETDSIVSNIDANFQNYYTINEVDEIVSNIETGEGGGSDGKIFTFRNDGHAYCDYVMEIVDRCIEGKLSTIKFGIDNDIQGTASILNFSKIFKPDFDETGEEGWQYYLTILYQNKEQTETKTYWYYVGDFSNGMTGTGIWEGTYDYKKLGYIIAPEIKPFGGGDGRVIKINSNYSIPVDDLNYAIDSIINGKNVVFELPDGSKTSFYYEVAKFDNYNEFGNWVSLTRKITIVDTKGYSSFDNAEYYHYNYELNAVGGYTSSSYDEIGNVVIDCASQGKLIEGGSTFVSIDVLGTLSLVNVDAVLTNNGTLNQEGQAKFSSPVTFNHRVDIEGALNFNNVNGQLINKGALDQRGQADFLNVVYFNNNTYCNNLNVSGATNVKSLTTNGAVNLKGGFSDEVNIDMRTNINRELKLNGGTSTFEDITFGIACDLKAQDVQITDLYNRNIIAGNNEESINFKDADKNIIAKVDISGNIYEGETKLSDKYATKEDITAINNTLNQIKQQLGIE